MDVFCLIVREQPSTNGRNDVLKNVMESRTLKNVELLCLNFKTYKFLPHGDRVNCSKS